MKLLFLLISSLVSYSVLGASCCVSNTSISNLMIIPADWQETFTLSQSRVIGNVDEKGESTFWKKNNKDVVTLARLDLAYGWNSRYQTGVSLKYQNREKTSNNAESSDSGWNDVGLSHSYRLKSLERFWLFQTLNIPTARSLYDSQQMMTVDARGTGTYQTSAGFFGISNFKEWDVIYSSELHHSFNRTFSSAGTRTEVGSFWGTSITGGIGYIPWRSKARYGLNLTPRYEGAKTVTQNGSKSKGDASLVWDTSLNLSYSLNAYHAVGVNYTDQTIFGPVRNTLLNRSFSVQFQSRWF